MVDLVFVAADSCVDGFRWPSLVLRVAEYGERQGPGEKVSAGFREAAKCGRHGESSVI